MIEWIRAIFSFPFALMLFILKSAEKGFLFVVFVVVVGFGLGCFHSVPRFQSSGESITAGVAGIIFVLLGLFIMWSILRV